MPRSRHGKIELAVRINTAGRVARVETRGNTTENDELATCVVSKVKRWRLAPATGGDATVHPTLVFRSK